MKDTDTPTLPTTLYELTLLIAIACEEQRKACVEVMRPLTPAINAIQNTPAPNVAAVVEKWQDAVKVAAGKTGED